MPKPSSRFSCRNIQPAPCVPRPSRYLRNVQEVIADGEFRIGKFYYVRARTNPADYPAAAARLVEVSERYPLYSQADDALWMLSSIYERAKKFSKNEDDKNHWGDLAAKCYDRIVTEYPMSKLAPDAKARLQGMGMPVPPADPEALARMQKDSEWEKEHHPNAVLNAMSAFKAGPDVVDAARAGAPNPNPPDDAVSATEVLKQGAAGPTFGLDAQQPAACRQRRQALLPTSLKAQPCRRIPRAALQPPASALRSSRPLPGRLRSCGYDVTTAAIIERGFFR